MENDNKSREAAFLVIKKVLDEGETLDGSIERFCREISVQDRAFIRHLTTTAIRRLEIGRAHV